MRKRLVLLLDKNTHSNYLDRYIILGSHEISQKEFEKLDVVFSFKTLSDFNLDLTQEEILAIIKEEEIDFDEVFYNKKIFDKNNLQLDWMDKNFITYDEKGNIVNIEKLSYKNKYGIMDSFNNESVDVGIFMFKGKRIGLNLEHIFKEKQNFDQNLKSKQYHLERCVNTDNLFMSEEKEDEELWNSYYETRKDLFYLRKETQRMMIKEKQLELSCIPDNVLKMPYKPKCEFENKYGKEKGHLYYIEQPLIKKVVELKKEGKISLHLYLNIEELYFLGKKKYMNQYKYTMLNTSLYLYNNKVKIIHDLSKTKKNREKQFLERYRQYRTYFKRKQRAIKNRKIVQSLIIHY